MILGRIFLVKNLKKLKFPNLCKKNVPPPIRKGILENMIDKNPKIEIMYFIQLIVYKLRMRIKTRSGS